MATSGLRAVLVERLQAALVDEQAASRRSERRERGVDKLTKGSVSFMVTFGSTTPYLWRAIRDGNCDTRRPLLDPTSDASRRARGGQARRAISSEAKRCGACDGTRGGRAAEEAPRGRRSRREARRGFRGFHLTLPYLVPSQLQLGGALLHPKLAVDSISEVPGASKAHLEVVNGPVP